MENNFVVEVLDTPQDAVALAQKIAPIFNLKAELAMGLIRRMPGVVTKPASEKNSNLIASRLKQVGLNAIVRPATAKQNAKPAASRSVPAAPQRSDEAAATSAARPTRPATRTTPASTPPPIESEARPESRSSRPAVPDVAATPTPSTRPVAERSTPLSPSPAASEQRSDAFRPSTSTPAVPDFVPPPSDGASRTERAAQTPDNLEADRERQAATDPVLQEISPEEIAARLTAAQQAKRTMSEENRASRSATPEAVNVDVRQSAITAPDERPQRQAARTVKPARRRRGSLRRKLLSAALIPTLISLIGALAIVWFIARPALYEQLLASAQNPAVATAAGISASLEEQALGQGSVDVLRLLDTILITKDAFGEGNISFVVATDTQGKPYSSYFADASSFTVGRGIIEDNIRQQATRAIATPDAVIESNTLRTADATLQIVAQPLIANDSAFGAIVVGVTDRAVSRQVNQIFITMGILSLALFLLALLIAQGFARPLTRNVLSLTQAADQISRGDLETSVTTRSNDELDDLSTALERLRVSMKEAIERLRRRRG